MPLITVRAPQSRGLLKQLNRIADALERIANAAEGKVPPEELPDADDQGIEDPPVELTNPTEAEFARNYAIEQELTRVLGRAPTSEEIVRAIDGEEWTVDDAERYRRGKKDVLPERYR